jgi:hypothetical protein
MRRVLIVIAAALVNGCATAPSPANVPAGAPVIAASHAPPPPCTRAAEPATPTDKAELALSIADCLENPDPALRDDYAFTTLSSLLRSDDIDPVTLRTLRADLLSRLASANADMNGFRGPFAALGLSEVTRTDRIAPWMSEAERSELIAAAGTYLAALTDYRGFSEAGGWRHGVAHTADLLMQLSLNPQLTRPQAEAILAAVALKVGTPEHAYVFGESERLAAPVTYLAFKETFTADEWSAWFTSLWPPEDPARETVFKSETSLVRLHNLRAFAQSVYVNAMASNDDRMKPVAGAALQFMNQLP